MILKRCPVCEGEIKITEIVCRDCGVKISGEFEPGDFSGMDREISDFIKVFVYTEGNIKQVEKLLNCSYPKVKNLLKKSKKALGFSEEPQTGGEKLEVLELLDKGEIDFTEAMKRLGERG